MNPRAVTEQRRRRQRDEILAIGSHGEVRQRDLARAVALVRDHLSEFPSDLDLVRSMLQRAGEEGDEGLRAEARELLSSLPTDLAAAP
jgi:hypothetical protein